MRSLSLLVKKELNALFAAPAFWLFLLCVALLTGYSFIAATRLFAEASRSAIKSPALARGLSPLDGIFVPTLGGLYLGTTLLYPFLAIRFISSEKESGSLKLSLQLPTSMEEIVAAKGLALAAGWTLGLAVPISAVVLWLLKGGHIGGLELANLLLGHLLYAVSITGIALLSASIADSTAAAALLTLAFILGNWALDFAASTETGWIRGAAGLSLTGCLRSFEKGRFSSTHAFALAIAAVTSLGAAAVCLRAGETRARRAAKAASIFVGGALLAAFLFQFPIHRDASEDKRNSFKPADERALLQFDKPLKIRVYLSPEDSRLWDLEQSVLAKLRRAIRKIDVELQPSETSVATTGNDRYGLIVIEYGGKTARTRSTSEEEILPIIYDLVGVKAPLGRDWDYPGYPLVADFSTASLWFYAVMPGLLAAGWWRMQRKTA